MEPIINPMWFYWIDVISGLEVFAITILVLACMGISGLLMVCAFDESLDPFRKNKRLAAAFLVCAFLSANIVVFVPSKETMITMVVAQNVTTENIEKATDTVKSMIDYTVETYNKAKQNN